MPNYKIGDVVEVRLDGSTRMQCTVIAIKEVGHDTTHTFLNAILQTKDGQILPQNLPMKKKIKQIREPKPPQARPYTERQFNKLCKQLRSDLEKDHADHIEDACVDTAQGILSTDPRIAAYFEKTGIRKQFWMEAFADSIHG